MLNTDSNLLTLLMDQIRENSKKLDEMKDSYYQLKSAVESHQIMDEKMHQDVCGFMQDTNKKLNDYNRQLEIHIAGTIENRNDIAEFKATIKPLLEDYIEENALQRANKKVIVKWTKIVGFIGVAVGSVTGILKLLELL